MGSKKNAERYTRDLKLVQLQVPPWSQKPPAKRLQNRMLYLFPYVVTCFHEISGKRYLKPKTLNLEQKKDLMETQQVFFYVLAIIKMLFRYAKRDLRLLLALLP